MSTPQEAIGWRRAAMRVALGMTQKQVSEKSGISLPAIIRAESGQPVTEDTLRAIAAALGAQVGTYVDPPATVPSASVSR